jgi:hypothetical protein
MPTFAELDTLAGDLAFWESAGADVKDAVRSVFLEVVLVGAAVAIAEEPSDTKELDVTIEEIATAAAEFVDTYVDEWWLELEAADRSLLRSAIQDAQRLGETPQFVIDKLSTRFDEVRARRIAVTETTRLIGRGAQESYRKAGFSGWIWRTVRDIAVDQTCRDLQAASDPNASPPGTPFPASRTFNPAHVNCRCWPVPAGDPLTVPDDGSTGGEIQEYEKTIVNRKTEQAAAFTRGGVQKFKKNGGKSSVPLNDEIAAGLLDDAILTHNHPSGGSFSPTDLMTAANTNLAEIRAVGSRGTFSMRRPADGWLTDELKDEVVAIGRAGSRASLDASLESGALTPGEVVKAASEPWQRAIRRELQDKVVAGEMTRAAANERYFDEVWARASDSWKWEYRKE